MAWSNGLAEWTEDQTALISVAFSWRLPDAYSRAIWYREQGYRVRIGGPAVWANRKYAKVLAGVAEVAGPSDAVDALPHHNPLATMASRGCPVNCPWCIVPKMEGTAFTLLPDFIPRPILCDNNLSALPEDYQRFIIDKYVRFGVPLLDANSGFEPRTFDHWTYYRWSKILRGDWRFALDHTNELNEVARTMAIIKLLQARKGQRQRKMRVYVLIGNEPYRACLDRIEAVIGMGGEPHVQALMRNDTLVKRPVVAHDWTEQKLMDVARWSNRWIWRHVPFGEYSSSSRDRYNNHAETIPLFQ